VLDTLHAYAMNQQSGSERESAPSCCTCSPPCSLRQSRSLSLLHPRSSTSTRFWRHRAQPHRRRQDAPALFSLGAASPVLRQLKAALASAKWGAKVGALDTLSAFAACTRERVAVELAATLPAVEHDMRDKKCEALPAANKCATVLCDTLAIQT
jgi:elongation factor 3